LDRPVDRYPAQIETDNTVIGGKCLSFEPVEHTSFDLFVAASTQGDVRHLVFHQRFNGFP